MNIDKIVLGPNGEQFYPLGLKELNINYNGYELNTINMTAYTDSEVLRNVESRIPEIYIRID